MYGILQSRLGWCPQLQGLIQCLEIHLNVINSKPNQFHYSKQVLKNCEPELSYILAELFSKCLKESCFPDCWKVSSVVPVFKNVGERSTVKNYHPFSLLSVVSKVFEKLLNNRIVDHLEKCILFSDFQVFSINCRPSNSFN